MDTKDGYKDGHKRWTRKINTKDTNDEDKGWTRKMDIKDGHVEMDTEKWTQKDGPTLQNILWVITSHSIV